MSYEVKIRMLSIDHVKYTLKPYVIITQTDKPNRFYRCASLEDAEFLLNTLKVKQEISMKTTMFKVMHHSNTSSSEIQSLIKNTLDRHEIENRVINVEGECTCLYGNGCTVKVCPITEGDFI